MACRWNTRFCIFEPIDIDFIWKSCDDMVPRAVTSITPCKPSDRAGNLSSAVVVEMVARFERPESKWAESYRYRKVLNEPDWGSCVIIGLDFVASALRRRTAQAHQRAMVSAMARVQAT